VPVWRIAVEVRAVLAPPANVASYLFDPRRLQRLQVISPWTRAGPTLICDPKPAIKRQQQSGIG
jgi:hypothetical protein